MKRDTRHIIAEQAQRVILGGSPTPDTEVRVEELLIFVDQAFGKMIRNSFFENMQEGIRQVNGAFLYSYDVDVEEDCKKNLFYAKIPSTYVNLPLGVGIYQVAPEGDPFNTMIPLDLHFIGLSTGLPVERLEGKCSYFVKNTKMYFRGFKPGEEVGSVTITLAGGIQPEEIDPEVEMPLDMQSDLVSLTVELYMTQQQMPKDDLNDNNKSA